MNRKLAVDRVEQALKAAAQHRASALHDDTWQQDVMRTVRSLPSHRAARALYAEVPLPIMLWRWAVASAAVAAASLALVLLLNGSDEQEAQSAFSLDLPDFSALLADR